MPVLCSALPNPAAARAFHWPCTYEGTVTKNVKWGGSLETCYNGKYRGGYTLNINVVLKS